jgi:hypothetical protein
MVKSGGTCIETNENGNRNVPFDFAAELCAQRGRRLCTYGEWRRACEHIATLQNMTDNGELVDQVVPTLDGGPLEAAVVVGEGACNAVRIGIANGYFRCCL